MVGIDILLLLSVAMTLVAALGRKYLPGMPYPTLMVFAGLAIAFSPGLPEVAVSPDVVKNVILPPLLYSAAWYTTWATLRRQSIRVAGLSIGLVLATTGAVGMLIHLLHPELPVAVGLVLGAIVSPPDAIAAVSISTRLGLPSRIVGLLEGESLINDATSLIVYKLALGVALAGAATSGHAGALAPVGAVGSFLWVAGGGVCLGVAAGSLLVLAHRRLNEPLLGTVLTLQAPYLAFLPADAFGLSGVLAVVVAGLVVGRRSASLFSAALRLQAIAVWDVVVFLLTGFAFVLIGLGVRQIWIAASGASLGALARDAVLACLVIVSVRIAWVMAAVGIERLWLWVLPSGRGDRATEARRRSSLSLGEASVVSWAGMRGVVSLAAALAIPLALTDGRPFPFRDEVLVLTFAAIVATLVGQGLSLPALIRRFELDGAHVHAHAAARRARWEATDAALKMLNARRESADDPALVDLVAETYRQRRDALGDAGVASAEPSDRPRSAHADRHADLHREAVAVERAHVVAMRNKGDVDDEALHRVLRDLDLEEARLSPTPQTRGIT